MNDDWSLAMFLNFPTVGSGAKAHRPCLRTPPRQDEAIDMYDDPAVNAEEKELMNDIRTALQMHRMPPVLLGSGSSKLVHKFSATLHSIFLETGSISSLQRFCAELCTTTTDLGVEFNLANFKNKFWCLS